MPKKRGRPATAENTRQLQITISKAAFAYLWQLTLTTTMGGTPNAVAAHIVGEQLERMRLSGNYPREVPPPTSNPAIENSDE